MNYYSMSAEEIQKVILAEARDCFLRDGYAATDIKKIAEKIKLSRSALYRYYPQKEKLALQVMSDVMWEAYQDAMAYSRTLTGDGWTRYYEHTTHHLNNFLDNPGLIVFTADFDRAFTGDYGYEGASGHYVEVVREFMAFDMSLIEAGQEDGSIRTDVSASLISSVVINSTAGITQRICPRSAHIEAEHSNEAKAIVRQMTDLIFISIKKEFEGTRI